MPSAQNNGAGLPRSNLSILSDRNLRLPFFIRQRQSRDNSLTASLPQKAARITDKIDVGAVIVDVQNLRRLAKRKAFASSCNNVSFARRNFVKTVITETRRHRRSDCAARVRHCDNDIANAAPVRRHHAPADCDARRRRSERRGKVCRLI